MLEQHRFGLLAGHDHQPQQLGVARGVGGAGRGLPAGGHQRVGGPGAHVEAAHRVAGLDEVDRHRHAHRAQADESDFHGATP